MIRSLADGAAGGRRHQKVLTLKKQVKTGDAGNQATGSYAVPTAPGAGCRGAFRREDEATRRHRCRHHREATGHPGFPATVNGQAPTGPRAATGQSCRNVDVCVKGTDSTYHRPLWRPASIAAGNQHPEPLVLPYRFTFSRAVVKERGGVWKGIEFSSLKRKEPAVNIAKA